MTAKKFKIKYLSILTTLVTIALIMGVPVQAEGTITWYPPYDHQWDNVDTPTDTKDAIASKNSGTVSLRAYSSLGGITVKGAVGHTWVPSQSVSSIAVTTRADWQYGLYVVGVYGKVEIWIELCNSEGGVLISARVYKKEIYISGWARQKKDDQLYTKTLSYSIQSGTTYIVRMMYLGYVQGGWLSRYDAAWYDIYSYATCHFDYIQISW